MKSRPFRWIARALLAALALLLVALVLAGWAMRASLPRIDGELALGGLDAPVRIERDALGTVTVSAASEADAMRALGFVHAQERFFEMDLMRRTSAGELAGLFGPRAVELDRQRRVHRMRARVLRDLDLIAGDRRDVLQAYTDGVNAGLASLKARPWPYLLLRTQPAPWRPEDTPLVGHAMYFDLQDASNARELALWRIKPHLPDALFALLVRSGSRWDAPIDGAARGDATLPTAAELDLRTLPQKAAPRTRPVPVPAEVGSNNFAVSGALTRDGRAIVADDMHLALRAPNIWFRARLVYPDPRAPHGRVDVAGFTLPGLPVVVVGSNTHVAWGFTNSYGDWLDWQRVPACDDACAKVTERIHVAGAADVRLDVEETPWGPVLHRDADGTGWALRWVAHLPGALTLGLGDMARATDVEDALRVADRTGVP
ncbi:MAG TPA: penicillin acylase family protein, partial [Lysobacter sp.]